MDPEFYQDLEPKLSHPIAWRTFGITGNLDIDLYREGVGKVADQLTLSTSYRGMV
jgi:hypothetical protein